MTPPLVPKKRVLSDNPKKKRVRKKDEVQTILTKEKTIIISFSRKFTPRSSEMVGQRLGRSSDWVKNQQKNSFQRKNSAQKFHFSVIF